MENYKDKVIEELKKAANLLPEVNFGRLIKLLTNDSDILYISDKILYYCLEHGTDPADADFMQYFLNDDKYLEGRSGQEYWIDFKHPDMEDLTVMTVEKEQISYDRYMISVASRVFFPLTEELPLFDFLSRFSDCFGKFIGRCTSDDNSPASLSAPYNAVTVINHVDNFYDHYPDCLRWPGSWKITKKDNIYKIQQGFLPKIPDFCEVAFHCIDEAEGETFYIMFDQEGCPVAENYAKKVLYGVMVSEDRKSMEFLTKHQTIQQFHRFFPLCTVNELKI